MNKKDVYSYDFYIEIGRDKLHFRVKITDPEVIMGRVCIACPLERVCGGSSSIWDKEAVINLRDSTVRNLTPKTADQIPCHAGTRIIEKISQR